MDRCTVVLGIVIGATTVLGCSGTDDSSGPVQSGGDTSAAGGNATGGSVSSGGLPSNTGGAHTGGTLSGATGGTTGVLPGTGGSQPVGGTTGIANATGGNAAGGMAATGGANATGGRSGGPATGGSAATGGYTSLGGSPAATGGTPATGGKAATGGTVATGGNAPTTGGTPATGGKAATGGNAPTGGTKATGGSSSATGGMTGTSCGAGTSTSSDVVVTLSSALQKISGFGASTAWAGTTMSTADADTLWSTTSGAGFSLHRIRIDPTTSTSTSAGELGNAKLAVARGVTVWATPWTPPAADKSNNSTVMGTLTNGQDFASKLATFVTNMKNQGIPIYAVSSQNEPDANVTYESCSYTGATLASFVGSYMGAAVHGVGAKVMTPETQNWCGFPTFLSALEANTAAWGATDIVATHEYGCSPSAYPAIAQAGKEFWETEIYDTNATVDDGMGSALRIAALIHGALTVANMNAWHYWWVYGSGNGGLYDTDSNVWTKRLWVEGNYARFVRPGYQRVSTSGTVPSNVLLTAYNNPTDATVVVVAVNNNSSSTNLSVYISGAAPCSMTPWVTSSSDSLASKSSVTVSGSRFTFSLGAQSVTTFVGKP